MKKTNLLILVLFVCSNAYAQNIPDSLKQKSFDYLIEKFDTANLLLEKEIYTSVIIEKAKLENEPFSLITGYYLKSHVYKDERVLAYSDSVIDLTKNNSNKYQPASAFIVKGIYYYKKRAFKSAAKNFIEARSYALKHNNLEFNFKCNYYIGILKSRMGEDKEAISLLIKNYEYARSNEVNNTDFLGSIFAIANSFNELKQLDSAMIFNTIGVRKSREFGSPSIENHFRLNQGVTHYYKGEYSIALDSISNSIPKLMEIDDKPNLAVGYYYLGLIHKHFENKEKEIFHLKKVDSIFLKTKDVLPKIRDSYEILINHYKSENNPNQQLIYINRLIELDSILHQNELYINKKIIKEYDIPLLLAEKNHIINVLNSKDKNKKVLVFILITLLFLTILGFYLQFQKKKEYRKKFQELMNDTNLISKNPSKENITSKGKRSSLNLSADVIDLVLEKLERFEDGKQYLSTDMTLQTLAKEMNTNSKYLSKVINFYKGKPFIHYINDLRVEYAFNELKQSSNFRKYTLQAIANEIGFKKTESFSKAFQKKTGIKPSFFIKELSKSKL